MTKDEVHLYWNTKPCGTDVTEHAKYSKEYFEEIEDVRYAREPEIFSFAQFSRAYRKKVLEVGVGAGTDFVQFVRSGADAYGIDLTEEGINHVENRLKLYELPQAKLVTGDCENLPFQDNFFDLVYSWGVVHHTADTERAIREIFRVARPGGIVKIMVYHKWSIVGIFFWVKHALFKFRPWKSISWCMANFMESPGTKVYSKREVRKMLNDIPACSNYSVQTRLTYYDNLTRFSQFFGKVGRVLTQLTGGDSRGWFLMITAKKAES